MYPIARRADLIIEEVGPDTLVYDQLRDAAHSLNAVTGHVFRHADGTRSIEQLSLTLSNDLGGEVDPEIVLAAIAELERVHLLDEADFSGEAGVSRREAMVRVGVATLAIVAITSISVPTPAMAKSWGYMKPPKAPKPRYSRPNASQVKQKFGDMLKRIFSKFGRP